jgi:hypothetical protein
MHRQGRLSVYLPADLFRAMAGWGHGLPPHHRPEGPQLVQRADPCWKDGKEEDAP